MGSPEIERLSPADGNVTSGPVVGVHVLDSPKESVVLFNSDHSAAARSTGADYVVAQATDALHLLFDVAPGGYTATATPTAGGKLAIHVAPGGLLIATGNGTLAFDVSKGAIVSSASPPPAAPVSSMSPRAEVRPGFVRQGTRLFVISDGADALLVDAVASQRPVQ